MKEQYVLMMLNREGAVQSFRHAVTREEVDEISFPDRRFAEEAHANYTARYPQYAVKLVKNG
ncbi:hypothetical protein [Alkalicoccus urumqiensis]|uniref:Uncharacterized protein n=1 Tax=Alkalicoccus urumqiensis TaxID=1548213 RepID=A0A2P6MH80_ALKUR|nr:hypothetical protein [Alkalicoccus urumqiensis]PRO65642.1 hypothetical protein C6I21_08960 [Alkalicoccus urumqiensis]